MIIRCKICCCNTFQYYTQTHHYLILKIQKCIECKDEVVIYTKLY